MGENPYLVAEVRNFEFQLFLLSPVISVNKLLTECSVHHLQQLALYNSLVKTRNAPRKWLNQLDLFQQENLNCVKSRA